METLLSYRPSDLLLFSPRVYWQLVEAHNETYWPLPWLALLAAIAVSAVVWRPKPVPSRVVLASSGLVWGFVTWSFVWSQYRPINWVMAWAVIPFVVQGVVMLLAAAWPADGQQRRPHRQPLALLLILWGGLAHPLWALVEERGWAAADTWLLFPDPLAVTTLGIALGLLTGWRLALLLPVPMLWSLVGGATLLGLESPAGWGLLAAFLAALIGWLPLTRATYSQRGT